MSRPILIVALSGDELLATAALTSAAADEWTVALAGGDRLSVTGQANVQTLLEQLGTGDRPGGEKYERDDPETGAPLPPGVDGFAIGGRRRAGEVARHARPIASAEPPTGGR